VKEQTVDTNERSPLLSRRAVLLAAAGATLLAGCGPEDAGEPVKSAPAITTEPTETPTFDALYGPDTSRGDTPVTPEGYGVDRPAGLLDAVALRDAGIAYHIAKASRGSVDTELFPWREPNFKESRLRADDAGLLFGAYHFLDVVNGTPEEQAEAFVEQLDQTGGAGGIMHMVDFEQYLGDGSPARKSKIYRPTHDQLLAFVEAHRQLTDGHPLGVYSANWYWGGKDRIATSKAPEGTPAEQTSILNNPPAPDGTYLWWNRILRHPYPGMRSVAAYDELISRPDASDNPWRNERLGTYAEYVFRQFVINEKSTDGGALLQQFDGSTGENGHLMSLDMNVTFKPFDYLLSLAGLKAGSLPSPKPLQG
jgi:GH25 family lysozyme M1 (1,4-beta-N-acetylmuramidase)